MRVALNRLLVAAFNLALQFTQTTQELMVELAFSNQLISFTSERAFNFGEFFREQRDDGLRCADEQRLQILDVVHKAVDEADNSTFTLRVNPGDVSLAIKVHGLVPESEVVERAEGKEQTWRANGNFMYFVYSHLVG